MELPIPNEEGARWLLMADKDFVQDSVVYEEFDEKTLPLSLYLELVLVDSLGHIAVRITSIKF